MLPTRTVNECVQMFDFRGGLILVPPHAFGTPWLKRLAPYKTGFASGWMGADNGRAAKYDRGFTLSDHADWPSLLRSDEHTSELQSLMRISYAVFWLKKKKITKYTVRYCIRR